MTPGFILSTGLFILHVRPALLVGRVHWPALCSVFY